MKPTIELRPLPQFPNHYVGVDGSVWSKFDTAGTGRRKGWNKLKTTPNKKRGGKHSIVFSKNRKSIGKSIHRLVLETFVGPCPKGMEARHLDDNSNNNQLSNLAWGTPKQNTDDKRKNGKVLKGERNGYSKLSDNDVRRIRKMYSTGKYYQRELADQFQVDQALVSLITRKKIWRHL